MSVSDVGNTPHAARVGGVGRSGLVQNAAFDRLSVGQIVNVHVLRRFDTHRYLLNIDGQRHHVESATELPVGGTGRASVAAIGERLELRIESLDNAPAGMDEATDVAQDVAATADPRMRQLVSELESRYRIALDEGDRSRLAAAVAGAAHPDTMARSGLFLNRLGMAIANAATESVYAAQVGDLTSASARAGLPEIASLVAALVSGSEQARASLTQLLMEALDGPDASSSSDATRDASSLEAEGRSESASMDIGADSGGGQDNARQELARWLLNLQDDGSIGHRYGTLPVLVGGQLVELDLVLFRQRFPDERSESRRAPLRRLVMTLNTESFGTLQVTAQAVDNRLAISFSGRSAAHVQALSGHADEVRHLAEQLGWNVDHVVYDCDPAQRRAAARVVDHVLDGGSIDRVL